MGLVHCAVEGGIAQVRLDRPDKLNALTLDTLAQLATTARWLRRDREFRAVVIAGQGDAFCAGLDFATVLATPARVAAGFVPRPWRGTNVFQEACWSWRRLPVPVIAAVHGHCLGGGLQIALAADFRFATPMSTWSVLEGKWGLVPDMTGIRSLAELVGLETAKRLAMTAELFDGRRAQELGLVGSLADDPVADATAFAVELSRRSPDALAAAKRLFTRSWTASPRRTFARERLEQAFLLLARNTAIARDAALAGSTTSYQRRAR